LIRAGCAASSRVFVWNFSVKRVSNDEYFFVFRALKGIQLPEFGQYATGILYLDANTHLEAEKDFDTLAASLGIKVIAWRDVPTDSNAIGVVARKSEPVSRQVFLTADLDKEALKKQIFVLRKRATHEVSQSGRRFYICSLSTRTIVYKGLFNSDQLWHYYTDLRNPEFDTYLALVHTRFSTNTFPSWERAHPLRVLAHNGEINTLRGNVNFMKAREGVMKSDAFGEGKKDKFIVKARELHELFHRFEEIVPCC
jgi:glutamate synthase (NADH)